MAKAYEIQAIMNNALLRCAVCAQYPLITVKNEECWRKNRMKQFKNKLCNLFFLIKKKNLFVL